MGTIDKIELHRGDITKLDVDAIVNAANKTLLGGGGVDGVIHRAAGKKLLRECKKLGGCEPGDAKITGGYNLPAKHVIHTVGPIWRGGGRDEDNILRNCYINSFRVASENGIKSIAFPAISTGAYRFPIDRASKIAIDTTIEMLEKYESIDKCVFALLGTPFREYTTIIKKMK